MAKLTCSDGTVIQISKETETELRVTFGPKLRPRPKLKFGDIVMGKYSSNKYVLLYDKNRVLRAHRCSSSQIFHVDSSNLSCFTLTGKNIFTDNLLDLGH